MRVLAECGAVSHSVLVLCPDCLGASADNRLPPCLTCNCNGHFRVNRTTDGTVPATWDDGRPMTEWLPEILPELPLAHPRHCVPPSTDSLVR